MNLKKIAAISFTSAALLFANNVSANDDLWGCEVLLCLSNPAGPMAVAQCVPPITRLYRAIFKKHPDPFPTCPMAAGPNGERNEAMPQYNDYYDPCPEGTRALASGAYAVHQSQVRQTGWRNRTTVSISSVYTGIGEGNYRAEGSKVCVGNQTGSVSVDFGSNDSTDYRTVGIYDNIQLLRPYNHGFSIKVYQNNSLLHVVRPEF